MSNTTRKSATLRDVAALAGISKSTAARALAGKGKISPEKREVALRAAQQLGFQPDLYAQHLANGRNHNLIGLLSTNDMGVLTEQAAFIYHRLNELNFVVQMHNVPYHVNHFEDRQIALVNLLRRQRPAAIIAGSPMAPGGVQELQLYMQEGGVVVGYLARQDLECDQVPLDLRHRAYLAARHLLELGHREIGFCFHGGISQDSPELVGFSDALTEFGTPVQNDWLFEGGNYEEGGARLAEAYLSWAKKPTGLCVVNDVSASAFVTYLHRNGFSVPGDVSVVGFDDARAARYALVPLTSVSYPLDFMGSHVVEFTKSRLNGYDGPPRTVVAQSELVTRSSTAPYRTKSRSRTRIP
jgi:DNA-binding LacI/PurR family transcriptional regulator